MLFKAAILDRIQRGEVTLAFRRWRKPSVLAGRTLRTPVGILAIDTVEVIEMRDIGAADAVKAGFADREAACLELQRGREGVLYRIAFHRLAPDPREALRRQDRLDDSAWTALRQQLAGLDDRSRSGPWALRTLRLIAGREGITAAELAVLLGTQKLALKLKIRKLGEAGLTESLPSGYRLSPRGRRFLATLAEEEPLL